MDREKNKSIKKTNVIDSNNRTSQYQGVASRAPIIKGESKHKTNPKLIFTLGVVILIAIAIKFSNPNGQYSTREYWQNADVSTVSKVPESALQPGNKNGSVLMWAATTVTDPEIIKALVNRGADVNDVDPFFAGTPLSGAATYNTNPEIINTLVDLGANVNYDILYGKYPLMYAAENNTNPDITLALLENGADINKKDDEGDTALDYARKAKNTAVIDILKSRYKPVDKN